MVSTVMMDNSKNSTQIVNTTSSDFPLVLWLFEQVMKLNDRQGYKVWTTIDKTALHGDIENKLQYNRPRKRGVLHFQCAVFRSIDLG